MLTIVVPPAEAFNDETHQFITFDAVELQLEHSLVSVSKWEATWEKPFLGPQEKTTEETYGYIQTMCVTPNTPPEVFQRLSQDNLIDINNYIKAKNTATWFKETPEQTRSVNQEVITAEIIYYWMITLKIPLECENWHFNRLMTLIRVTNEKNAPPKKMTPAQAREHHRAVLAKRRAQMANGG